MNRLSMSLCVVIGTLVLLDQAVTQPVDPPEITDTVELLVSDSVSDRYRGLRSILDSETLQSNDRIRLALFGELDRFNRALLRRYYQWGQGGRAGFEDDYPTEFGLDVLELVLRLRDERAIPMIVESTAVGGTTAEVLAEWGDAALPAVLAAWHGKEDRPELGVPLLRAGLLRTMTHMIERNSIGMGGRAQVLSVAWEALERPVRAADLGAAIRLSIALADADLVAVVERIAEDVVEVLSLVNDPDQVESIQRTARESLDRP